MHLVLRDRATYFCFESWDSMILLVRSPELLKESHKTGSTRAMKCNGWHLKSMFSVSFTSQGHITNSKVHFLGSTLHKNALFLH